MKNCHLIKKKKMKSSKISKVWLSGYNVYRATVLVNNYYIVFTAVLNAAYYSITFCSNCEHKKKYLWGLHTSSNEWGKWGKCGD